MALSKKQKIIAAIIASLTGVSGMSVTAAVFAYDAFFPRYERPDYRVYPGQYCIERMPSLAGRKELWINSSEARIKAYYYEATNPKGLVVFAHGIHAGADE